MNKLNRLAYLLHLTRSHSIMRRYFVVNGFDGALTMLGLILGFLFSGSEELPVVISACLGAAIALGISGISSAYVSEVAERQRALIELEEAMVTDLDGSAHQEAARWVPVVVAFVNGAAPLIISLVIIIPLWLASAGMVLPLPPLQLSIGVSLSLIFLLGLFLGSVSGGSWLLSGLRTLLVALLTALLVYLFTGV